MVIVSVCKDILRIKVRQGFKERIIFLLGWNQYEVIKDLNEFIIKFQAFVFWALKVNAKKGSKIQKDSW